MTQHGVDRENKRILKQVQNDVGDVIFAPELISNLAPSPLRGRGPGACPSAYRKGEGGRGRRPRAGGNALPYLTPFESLRVGLRFTHPFSQRENVGMREKLQQRLRPS